MRKPKYIVIFVFLIANTLMLCFAPRFGWTLRNDDPFNPYKYQDQRKVDNQIVAVYESSNSTLEIGYENRFSRNLEMRIDKEGTYNIKIKLDGGIDGSLQWSQQPALDFVLSDIVWKDSSGIFYYRYILFIGAMFGCILCYIKAKPTLKTLYLSVGFTLAILSTLISLRVIT